MKPLPPLWPPQERAIQQTIEAIQQGSRGIVLQMPTGAGKTRVGIELIRWARESGMSCCWFTHRRVLLDQTNASMDRAGIDNRGIMAAGYDPSLLRDVQVASLWTVASRVLRREKWEMPRTDLAIVDEAHLQAGPTGARIFRMLRQSGGTLIFLTATPVGLGHVADRLLQPTTQAELRQLGVLVPARHWAPTEPDLELIGWDKLHYTSGEQVKVIRVPRIFGNVFDNWLLLQETQLGVSDPIRNGKPTLLFAPSVSCSRWFRDEFRKRGVTAEHVDAGTEDGERRMILEAFREGDCRVLCSRFVMREGVDLPEAEHGILACVVGAYHVYKQMGGRLLRAHPGKSFAVIQDHAGAAFRHGSLNDDIQWLLGDTPRKIKEDLDGGKRRICPACHVSAMIFDGKSYRCPHCGHERQAGEPMRCPNCGACLRPGDYRTNGCPICGYRFAESVRVVIQVDGTLREIVGPRKRKRKLSAEELWERCFWACCKSRRRRFTMSDVRRYFRNRAHAEGLDVEEAWPPYCTRFCPRKEDVEAWSMYCDQWLKAGARRNSMPLGGKKLF